MPINVFGPINAVGTNGTDASSTSIQQPSRAHNPFVSFEGAPPARIVPL